LLLYPKLRHLDSVLQKAAQPERLRDEDLLVSSKDEGLLLSYPCKPHEPEGTGAELVDEDLVLLMLELLMLELAIDLVLLVLEEAEEEEEEEDAEEDEEDVEEDGEEDNDVEEDKKDDEEDELELELDELGLEEGEMLEELEVVDEVVVDDIEDDELTGAGHNETVVLPSE
jgi:hypothetical protein